MVSEIAQLLSSPWMYALVMVSITLDVFLPVLPSGSLLIVAVVYSVHNDSGTPLVLLFAGGAVASSLGDNLAFRIVRRGTGPVERRLARMPRVSRVNGRLRNALRTRTIGTMIFARLVPTGRTVAMAVGATDPELTLNRYRLGSAVSAVVWAAYTVGLGYLNAMLFDTAWVSVVTGLAAATAIGLVLARSRRAVALTGS